MKTTIDLEPLCAFVTKEVTPLHLVGCFNDLTVDYMCLLIEEMERGQPGTEVDRRTYDCIFELNRVSACLIEGMRRTQENGAEKPLQERTIQWKGRAEKAE